MLLLGLFQPSSAQVEDFTLVYYPSINDAELAITQNQHGLALAHYERAFAAVKNGFARDYRNAILCANEVKNDAFVFIYLEKLVLKSLEKEYFQHEDFNPLKTKYAWASLMDRFDALHQESLKKLNGEYLKELAAMGDRDQFFRAKEDSYEVYGDTIAKIDMENVLHFQELVNQFGFPSEDLIGAFIHEGNAPFNIVLHHHAQNQSTKDRKYPTAPSLAPLIQQAAKAGQCSPQAAGNFLSTQNDRALNYCAWGFHQVSVNGETRPYILIDKVLDSERPEIDALRAEIGLESMDDFRMKCQFMLDNPQSPYRLSCHQNRNMWELEEAMAKDFELDFDKITPTFGK